MAKAKSPIINERIQSMSAERQALLKRLAKQKSPQSTNPGDLLSIPQRGHDGPVPLSFAQRRLWFLHQLAPDSPFYDESTMLRLNTVINPVEFERSLDEIVHRHEALRTVFRTIDEEPVQVILPELHLPLLFRDLRLLPQSEREDEALRFASEELRKPFDLTIGPLLRCALLQIDVESYMLVLTMHHIICDGWSMDVLFRDLREIYGAFITRRPSPLPPLQIQYADYTIWQRERLAGESLDRLLSYWKRQLEDLSALTLPTDFPRPTVQSFRGAILRLELSADLTRRIKHLARTESVTVFVLLLAAFKILLYRHCGQEDIVIGAPVSGRNLSETQPLIGFFVNSLVLRSDLSGNPSFHDALLRIKQVVMDGFAHDELPFEVLVEHLQPERSLDRNPLFQVAFQYVNAVGQVDGGGLEAASAAKSARGTAIFDLALTLWEGSEGIAGELEYCTELFTEATVQRIARRFEVLLESITADPQQSIGTLSLMPEEEQQQVLEEWNQTQIDTPPLACVLTNFEEQVARRPQATAVSFGAQNLNYEALNRHANQLAHRLRNRGIGRESVVSILMQRSLESFISILAIIKSGAAYLPLDVAYPGERLNYILSDAGAALLLTLRGDRKLLPDASVPVLCVDDESELLLEESMANLQIRPDLDDLAYVIYTSGSTGRPKGVDVTHAGLSNLVRWHLRTYAVDQTDRATHVASFAYDAAVWEIWPYLTVGAAVHIADDMTRLSAAALIDWMARERITLTFLPTPLAEVVLDIRWPDSLQLKALLTGGDTLRRRPSKGLPCPVINHYGPTENSVVTTATIIDAEDLSVRPPPIGRPIDNNRVYVLDCRGQPVPIGVPGELHIGGLGLARGYRGQPALTVERFLHDPYDQSPNARIYASGDLVRWRDDGQIEFLGRIDHQVKIRGFRIELSEIETELCRHPAIEEAVVVVREDTANDRSLAAYIVARPESNNKQMDEKAEREQIGHWQTLYDETYNTQDSTADPAFNIVGWNDSYSGAPIPVEEMREWVDESVAKIRNLKPRRVLEIGCGTGLLLLRLAPDCDSYIGTDFSAAAIEFTGNQLHTRKLQRCVELRCCEATEAAIGYQSFDTVVLNSVIQYFPSVHYLVQVLEHALTALAPGGRLFVGDVRNLSLLRAFHTDLELHHMLDQSTPEVLHDAVAKLVAQDSELAVDPLFFLAFAKRFPQVRSVEFQLKRGQSNNELNRFRYDVVLSCTEAVIAASTEEELNWRTRNLDLDRLSDFLQKKAPTSLSIRQIPNAWVASAVAAAGLVDDGTSETQAVLEVVRQKASGSIAPGEWPRWAAQRSYAVALSWNLARQDGCYDVLLERRIKGDTDTPPSFPVRETPPLSDWTNYTNQPFQALHQNRLVPRLQTHLLQRLPDYMVPSSFTFLEALPLTPNGKLDRQALPPPHDMRAKYASGYVAPRNYVEIALAGIWADTLAIDRVGIHENFFSQLGGHSLIATQLMARINDAFRAQLPLQWIFESPTVAEFAAVMGEQTELAGRLERTAELLLSLDNLALAETQEAEAL